MAEVWLGRLQSSIFVSANLGGLPEPGGSLVARVRLVFRSPVTALAFSASPPTLGVGFLLDLFQLLALLRCQLRCQGALGLRNHLPDVRACFRPDLLQLACGLVKDGPDLLSLGRGEIELRLDSVAHPVG